MVLTFHNAGVNATRIPIHNKRTLCVSFMPNNFHLVAAEATGELRQWRADSGHWQEVTPSTMKANGSIYAADVSLDGRWIVTGDTGHKVVVWNADTHKIAIEVSEHTNYVYTVDVSSDSTRFASGSEDRTVRIFDIISGVRVIPPLQHNGAVIGVKFTPDGSRIATATHSQTISLDDAHSGNKLIDIPVKVNWVLSTPLAWASDGQQLFAGSQGKITSLDTSTSSQSDWAISNSSKVVSIVTHGQFIACSAGCSVSFWDYTSRQQIGSIIVHIAGVNCISISHDGRHLACGDNKGITVYDLGDLLPDLHVFRVSRVPLMQVSEAVLESWMRGNPTETESILSEEMARRSDTDHYAPAARSLIRAHLKEWKTATEDAEMVAF